MAQPATTMAQNRPYLGYPYSNPPVFDVPSLNPAEVAALQRYADLPRRQLTRPAASNESMVPATGPPAKEEEDRPTIYIDLPEAAPSSPSLKEDDERPVVYIDIPDSMDSGVSERARTQEDTEPNYVQETIYYDPFKDRRIDRDTGEVQNVAGPSRPAPSRPRPPNSLVLAASEASSSSYTPSFFSKESYVYESPQNDGFNLTPLSVNDFPPAPPPYEEVDTRTQPRVQSPAPEPPRTQVIVSPTTPTVIYDGSRKLVSCPRCQATVHTIIVKRQGYWTHVLAVLFLFVFFPLVLFIYWSDVFKYKDHYCPNCKQVILQERPPVCGDGD